MTWNAEDVPQQFPDILTAAQQEPQLIYQQKHVVAAVITADLLQEFLMWKRQSTTLAQTFAELRQICEEEDYILETPNRSDRPNPFAQDSV